MKQLFSFLIFLFYFSSTTISQNPEWINYTNGDIIKAIELEDNFIWVGTWCAGLMKIDRISGKTTFYDKLNSGLPSVGINCLVLDEQDNKWIGTWEGLVKFDGTNWTIYDTSNSGLRHNYINCISIDKYGNKWIGTGLWETKGDLVKFDDTNWTIYNTNSGMPQFSRVRCITIDQEDNKWIGTWPEEHNIGVDQWVYEGGGLVKFDGTNWTIYDLANSELSSNQIECISIDESGNKWIGTSEGLVKFDGTNWTIYDTVNSSLPDNFVSCLRIDESGIKWIGTFRGLINYDDDIWTKINTSNSGLPRNLIEAVAIDDSGNKWFGTSEYGQNGHLVKFDDTNWTIYNTNSGMPQFSRVRCITIDQEDNKWIGTWEGLVQFDGTNWAIYDTSNSGLRGNRINCLAIDELGNKWIGTGGGLAKFDGIEWTVFNEDNSGLPNNLVSCIAIDESDNKFIGTREGLVKLNSDNISWTPIAGLPEGGITEITIDAMGDKWIGVAYISWGVEGKGLVKLGADDTTLTIFNVSNSDLPGNHITSIAIDESNNKWIGTEWEGLVKFDDSDWTIYNESNSGIPSNGIKDIVVDASGNKWIGTSCGVAVFNEVGVVSEINEAIDNVESIPNNYKLFQNYPNPFNPATSIKYSIPINVKRETKNVKLIVYDILGREVATLVNQQQKPGNYEVTWGASNQPSGVYFYKLNAGNFIETKKMILLR